MCYLGTLGATQPLSFDDLRTEHWDSPTICSRGMIDIQVCKEEYELDPEDQIILIVIEEL